MKKKWLIVFAIAVGLALTFAVFRAFPIQEFWVFLASFPLYLLGAYVGVSLVIFLLLSFRWQLILTQHNISLPFIRTVAYRYVGYAISFSTPGPKIGGEPARAALLKRDGVEFPQALATVVADKTSELTAFAIMFLISLSGVLYLLPLPRGVQFFLYTVLVVLLGLVGFGLYNMIRGQDPLLRIFLLLGLHRIKWMKKYEKELEEFSQILHKFYAEDKATFWKAMGLSALAWSLSLIEFKIILTGLGLDAGFLPIFLVYSAVGLAYIMPVPLALGTLEAFQATVFSLLKMPTAAGAALAMVTRSRDFLWTIIGLMLLGYYGVSHEESE